MSIMPDPADRRGGSPERERTDAAWNAVAVASAAHHEARQALDDENVTFVLVLMTAQTYGLTMADLCKASGLDEGYLRRLFAETAR